MPQGFIFCLPKSYSTMKFGEYMYYYYFGGYGYELYKGDTAI